MARKEKKFHFIYKTTNTLTGKYYYGMHSTDNLDDDYLGSGRRLRYSINKYGKENHKREILEYCDNRKLLVERERDIVNLNEIAKEDCMNLMVGGRGGFVSDEVQQKRAKAGGMAFTKKLKENQQLQLEYSNRGRVSMELLNMKNLNCTDGFKNKHHSIETKEKMSRTSKGMGAGRNNSQYGTCWINKDGVNKKIKKELLEEYLNIGWTKGRKY